MVLLRANQQQWGGKNPHLKPPHGVAVPDVHHLCMEVTVCFNDASKPFWPVHICGCVCGWAGVEKSSMGEQRPCVHILLIQ